MLENENVIDKENKTDSDLFNYIKENGSRDPMNDPLKHDGCYEIISKVLGFYNNLSDSAWKNVSQNDLFFLLTCTLIRQSAFDPTIDFYLSRSLLAPYKNEIHTFFNDIWNKATRDNAYTNTNEELKVNNRAVIGLFSRSEQFKPIKETDASLMPKIESFIKLCIELNSLTNDKEEEAIGKIQNYIDIFDDLGNFQGKVSQILHVIKPSFFPILNGPGRQVYKQLGVILRSPDKFKNYAKCCLEIKRFRDTMFPDFKNYRVIDFYGSRYLNFFSRKDNKIINFELICQWLKDCGGKPYRKGDQSGKEPQEEITRFFKDITDGQVFSKYERSFWQISGNSLPYFWNRAYDENFASVKGNLSLSLSTSYDKNKNDLSIEVKLESLDDEIKTLSLEERKEINRKLLQKVDDAIYEDNIGNQYTFDEALMKIEEDDIYKKHPAFKIRPCAYLSGPFINSRTDDLVTEGKEIINKFIKPYFKMVKGDKSNMEEKYGKNLILYGPPGTGKTFNTKIYAVAICDGKTIDYVKTLDYKNEVLPRYNELVEEGRIAFTTFHQSYGYEEFIEGIQPLLDDKNGEKKVYYDVMPGIFKKFCEIAPSFFETVGGVAIQSNDFTKKWQDFIDDVNDGGVKYGLIKPTSKNREKELYVRSGVNIVLPLGSGLPLTRTNALKFFMGEKIEHNAIDIIKEAYDYFANKYLDNASIKAISNQDVKLKPKPCVFIIDEINRGNISKIFGELITLIEESKRQGSDEAMSCTLPYSLEPFSVPNNVYILGTMNTADRSIALIDTALRRRFDFIEMLPDKDVLKDVVVDGLNISELLETINKRIELLYDREHTIGHAYFMPLKKEPSISVLEHIFKDKIMPLLQEYFYEDYSKIRLIFGGNAFVKEEQIISSTSFKNPVPEGMLQEKKYTIDANAFKDINNYKNII